MIYFNYFFKFKYFTKLRYTFLKFLDFQYTQNMILHIYYIIFSNSFRIEKRSIWQKRGEFQFQNELYTYIFKILL